MNSKKTILKNQIFKFFDSKENMEILVKCIKNSNPVSLRLIDWFVTNYCKTNASRISSEIGIDIYNSYKGQLKSYNKLYFDPFCRNLKTNPSEHIFMEHDNFSFHTSLGQLNFFRWAINKNIIEYVKKNAIFLKTESKKKNKVKEVILKEEEVKIPQVQYFTISF
jgi:hypothetical protein